MKYNYHLVDLRFVPRFSDVIVASTMSQRYVANNESPCMGNGDKKGAQRILSFLSPFQFNYFSIMNEEDVMNERREN